MLSGRRYNGWGWNPSWDVTAQSNACVLTRSATPPRPTVQDSLLSRTSAISAHCSFYFFSFPRIGRWFTRSERAVARALVP